MPLSETVTERRSLPRAIARRRDREADAPLLGELHGIRHQIFDRGTQQRRIADGLVGQFADAGVAGEALGLGPRGEREGEPRGEARQRKDFAAQLQAALAGPRRLDRERGQLGKMRGEVLDRLDPAPLALAEPGGRQQLAERDDAGERRADVVGEGRERGFDDARRRALHRGFCAQGGALAGPRREPAFALERDLDVDFDVDLAIPSPVRPPPGRIAGHVSSSPGAAGQASPIIERMSAGDAPPARSSRNPVARVDFDSLRPSPSRIRR